MDIFNVPLGMCVFFIFDEHPEKKNFSYDFIDGLDVKKIIIKKKKIYDEDKLCTQY